ncbi:hypothetical protein EC968_009555 [Mortierella alpina]|nr:hypothetical protein EC968_009555 [Mortierella alpina]
MAFLSSRTSPVTATTTVGAPYQSSARSTLPSSGSQVTLVDNSLVHPSAKPKASKVANDENKGSFSKSKDNGTKSASDFKVSAMAFEEIHSRDMDERGLLLDAAEMAEADFLLETVLEELEKMAIVIDCACLLE